MKVKVIIKREEFERRLAEKNMSLRSLARGYGSETAHKHLSAMLCGRCGVGIKWRRRLQRSLRAKFDDLFKIVM
jgi:hypothetical protein